MSMPEEFESSGQVPEVLMGYIAVRSQGGVSAFDVDQRALESTEAFHASTGDQEEAGRTLESIGFEVVAESRLGKAVAGPPGAYEELTGGICVTREVLLHAEAGRERYVTHVDIVGDQQPETLGVATATSDASSIEGVLLERPRILQAVFPAPISPTVPKFHLRVPDDVALALGATAAHRKGHEGVGITVAMVDSGQYAHPFFLAHGYDIKPAVSMVPGASAARDPIGHGTGESANIFAVAPGATLRPYRASDVQGRLVGAISGFVRAKGETPKPQVLTNSWGGDGPYPPPGPLDEWDRVWALEIRDAVEQGIVVVFSAGNGSFTVEPQVPGVIGAGGVYASASLDLVASNYASGYDSTWFPGTRIPTVCGLVGLLPRAQYLMLPVPPGSTIDMDESLATATDTPDGTPGNDGWGLFSGTSAAAPQLAGAAAVLLGARRELSPAQVRRALVETATDVRLGRCHPRFNFEAQVGDDLATGPGLVNVSHALDYAIAL